MMKKLRDLDLKNQDVILRVDFNVPLNPEGQVIDDTRLKSTLPTINYLLNLNCRIILLSHLGRPEGQDPSLSLKTIIPHLKALLNQPILLASSIKEAKERLKSAPPRSIILLENLRFFFCRRRST